MKTRPGAILGEDVNDSLIDSQLKAQDTWSLVFNTYNSSLRLQKCLFMEVIQENIYLHWRVPLTPSSL